MAQTAKLTKDKKQALAIIGFALLLHWLARYVLEHSYNYRIFHTYEGIGLIIGAVGLIVWIYGFVKYARAKGGSELLAVALSFLWILGLVILLLLPDKKQNR